MGKIFNKNEKNSFDFIIFVSSLCESQNRSIAREWNEQGFYIIYLVDDFNNEVAIYKMLKD